MHLNGPAGSPRPLRRPQPPGTVGPGLTERGRRSRDIASPDRQPELAIMEQKPGATPGTYAPIPKMQASGPLNIRSKGCSAFEEAGVWSIGCEVVSDAAELAAARRACILARRCSEDARAAPAQPAG